MNPYIRIWLKPISTIEFVLSRKAAFFPVLPLATSSLVIACSILTRANSSIWLISFFFLFASITAYAIVAYLLPELVTKFGKMWHGMGSFKNIQLVFALASIPILLILILQILGFLFPEIKRAVEINYAIHILATILCFRNLIIGISIVQGFTYGQSVLNLIVSLLPLLLIRLALI